jgi:hypothetical protein
MDNKELNENLACSDGGCIFGHPGGMHTNGGCKCLTRTTMTRNELYIIKTKVRKLVAQKKEYKRLYEAKINSTNHVLLDPISFCASCSIPLISPQTLFCSECEEDF